MRAKFFPNPEALARRDAIRKIRQSTEYSKWRESVLERDGFKCIWCRESDRSKLTVDHISPLVSHRDKALELSNGRTLCHACHLNVTTHGRGSWVKKHHAIQKHFIV